MQSLAAGGISFAEQVARLSRQHAAAKLGAGATEQSVSVEVAGHSLGSALATYYVMENALTHKIKNPAICTFASPKVGDFYLHGCLQQTRAEIVACSELARHCSEIAAGLFLSRQLRSANRFDGEGGAWA